MNIYSVTARRLVLFKQGFHTCWRPGKNQILEVIRRLGCIQIDTINVVDRSQYLVLWSRLGSYKREYLDQLLYPDREVFEFWAHAASIIPIEYYRYFIHPMKENLKALRAQAGKRIQRLRGEIHLIDDVLEEIRRNGPMSSRDFGQEPRKEERQGWWDWKPAKIALELLYSAGLLMIAYRENFQRYYDLTEKVLPSTVDKREPSEGERRRFYIKKTVGAWGIVKPADFPHYFYKWSVRTTLRGNALRGTLQQLLKDDVLTEVTVDGGDESHYILTEDLQTLQKISEGDIGVFNRVTFISPFDNLTWDKNRVKRLFGFEKKFEAYIPREKREFGYYTLNILYRDQLVGRLDPKIHRNRNILEVKALRFEEGFKPDDSFKEKLEEAFRDFMEFHGAERIQFRKGYPSGLKLNID